MFKPGILQQLLLVITCTSLSTFLSAQPDIPKNVFGITQPDLIESMMLTMEGVGSNTRDLLREQSVKSYMMPPRDRGSSGSALCYAMSYCLEFYVNYQENYKVNLSPDYIQLSVPGADLRGAFTFLAEQGTVNAAIIPYQSRRLSPAVSATDKYQIKNYLHIFRPDTRDRQMVFETRKALMRGNPVLVELKVPASFEAIRQTKVWALDGQGAELDYVVVVGYNEDQELLEVLGSHGSTWGKDGYLQISYDDFGKIAQNGYVMVPLEQYNQR